MDLLEPEAGRLKSHCQPPPPDWLYAVFGIKLPYLLAGLFGGMVRGLVSKGFTWPQRMSSAIVGALTAGYATPAAVPILQRWAGLWGYRVGELEGSVGFALGLVGMTICDALIRWARRMRDGPPPFMPSPKSGR